MKNYYKMKVDITKREYEMRKLSLNFRKKFVKKLPCIHRYNFQVFMYHGFRYEWFDNSRDIFDRESVDN